MRVDLGDVRGHGLGSFGQVISLRLDVIGDHRGLDLGARVDGLLIG